MNCLACAYNSTAGAVQCTSCTAPKGIYILGDYSCQDCTTLSNEFLSTPNCVSCSATCNGCTVTATQCTACAAGLLNVTSNSTCVNSCPSNSIQSGTTCLVCNTGCATCTGAVGTCTSCTTGFVL